MKKELCPDRTANPVALHDLYAFRPTGHMIQISKQTICIICNFQEPLRQIFFNNRILTAPALPFFHLFICKNRMTMVTPVYFCFLFIRKPPLIKNLKKILRMFIIIFTASQDFSFPIIRKPELFLLTRHILNIRICPFSRSNSMLDSGIFRRHAESIISHRMNNIKPLHGFKAGYHVTNRVIPHMPHMKIARRIREHLKNIVFLFIRIKMSLKCFRLFPNLLPLFFNLLRNIFPLHTVTFHKHFIKKISSKTVIQYYIFLAY